MLHRSCPPFWKPMGERLPAEVLSYIRQHRLYEGE
jgi:nicotinic acid mononucleotide adenylyltransferase